MEERKSDVIVSGRAAFEYNLGNLIFSFVALNIGFDLGVGMLWLYLVYHEQIQLIGAIAGSALLGLFFAGYKATGANDITSLATYYAAANVDNFQAMAIVSGLVVEVVLTFFFVLAILGITSKKEDSSVAGLLIGVVLTGIHLVGIPLTGTSVNPARSLSAAIFAAIGGHSEPLERVWIFLLAPLAGAALAALLWKFVLNKKAEEKEAE